MKIIVFAHLRHRDYPWSVGRMKRLLTLNASDESMQYAERLTAAIRDRCDRKRLRAFWELRAC